MAWGCRRPGSGSARCWRLALQAASCPSARAASSKEPLLTEGHLPAMPRAGAEARLIPPFGGHQAAHASSLSVLS